MASATRMGTLPMINSPRVLPNWEVDILNISFMEHTSFKDNLPILFMDFNDHVSWQFTFFR
jgi:hypothetical protein